ncbi:MAG: HAD-IIB family hydrolase [Candidatus Aminicenantaceae bacterium]
MKEPPKENLQLLIFTDLDGTLLDHLTYSFQPALPALTALKERSIPLVFCTSKTRAETEEIRRQTGNTHPFIVENGGAIFVPEDYFSQESELTIEFTKKDEKDAEYQIIELGTPYVRLREALSQIQAQYPGKIKGFGDLSIEEVAKLCEFSLDDAILAKHREYDEPFVLEEESLLDKIQEAARVSNLQVTQGGRFYHLMGANDKGQAALRLIEIYGQNFEVFRSVALGDSLNDLPMLAAVDTPILLPKLDGRYDSSVKLDGLIFSKSTGPTGWCDAVLKIIHGS